MMGSPSKAKRTQRIRKKLLKWVRMIAVEIFISSTQANMKIKIKARTTREIHMVTITRTDLMASRMMEISTESRIFSKIETSETIKDFTRKATIATGEMKNTKITCTLTNLITKLIGHPLTITTTMKEMGRNRVILLRLLIQKRMISKRSGIRIKQIISTTNMTTILNSLNMGRNLMSSLAIMRMIKKIFHM